MNMLLNVIGEINYYKNIILKILYYYRNYIIKQEIYYLIKAISN